MDSLPKNVYRERIDFSKIKTTVPIPNLIEIQRKSYERFLQMNRLPSEREDAGLQSVFKSVFPISDFRENSSLEFIEYSIGNWECKCGQLSGLEHLRIACAGCGEVLIADAHGDHDVLCLQCGRANATRGDVCDVCGNTVALKLKYDVDECQEAGMTYAVPLKVTIRLVVWNKDPETGVKTIRDIKEQEVYFGDIPLMTHNGTFIINGTERVIVSQLHRSPGAFFHSSDKSAFVAQIIPYRGSWVEFEYDAKDLLYVRIDRKRKFLATVFLRALGLRSADEVIRTFYSVDTLQMKQGALRWKVSTSLVGLRAASDITISGSAPAVRAGKKISSSTVAALQQAGVEAIEVSDAELEGAFAAADVVDPATGEVILEANEEVTPRVISMAQEKDVETFEIFFPERDETGPVLSATLKKDTIRTHEEALIEIYRRLRPGDPPTLDSSRSLFESMFFNPQKYDFSRVGRLKLNTKLSLNTPLDEKILHPQDFYEVIGYLLKLRRNPANVDDIDHLGNRRVRSVGELLENQFRIGLVRMERAIKEKMSVYQEMATAMPHDLINAKPVMAAIREFFGSSQLSQFMDQTNPLSEITHKRRLSALGPGGLSRERAGFEVRDVHPTHYGRICPIETPEGPNIGLISSLSCYARINEFGFIESPYRRVKDGRVSESVVITTGGGTKFKVGDVVELQEALDENASAKSRKKGAAEFEPHSFYLSAWEEDRYSIAQANATVDDKGRLTDERVNARRAGEFISVPPEKVDFIDVSPKQLVSVAASLIPFLENDDANRALMGSNMQRQAVPLLRARAPFVGTGMEYITARDSGSVVSARRPGTVDYVDSLRIVVRVEGEDEPTRNMGADIYTLTKFKRSNQNTCISQKPIVRVGQRVDGGQVLADGPCTELGELALGRNVLVAFMPWRGYNFEDAILVSERMVKDDYYTSIHIEEFEIESRDTKLGPEEITRDIPNVSEGFLKDLDDSGIIRIGANVTSGDILVGKVTPKGETQLTPEEKLLRAIFGEKAGDVRDASLACPPGIDGIVVGVKIFSRKGIEKDDRAKAIEADELEMMEKNLQDEVRILHDEVKKRISQMLPGQSLSADLHDEHGREKLLRAGTVLTEELLHELSYDAIVRMKVATDDPRLEEDLRNLEDRTRRQIEVTRQLFEEKKEKIRRGDELPPGVIKLVKVYVAMKRKLSVGDKMAGRHGNKGVIARILPEEDMPYLPDGTPAEIVLNPLGVPSRMNVGQILETHLGWAAHALGLYFATPVFDGATELEIKNWLEQAGLPKSGKTRLYDGMTGQLFEQDVTVGYIYMLKLSHLVDEKIHARSIGPYSLITQQPLGGKAQFGGQRFGEMEVWALEAYGAAHILQELLTAKSDDVVGRAKIYEAIVKDNASFAPGLPESFNVLIRELQALCLDVELMRIAPKPVAEPPPAEDEAALGDPASGRAWISSFGTKDDVRPSFSERGSLTTDFDAIRISLASPERILAWSHGEVTKPETINYRTFKPERDGLFCAKIFGPVTDWECLCGKYKRMKHRGVICDKCGVEVTQAKVRRERLGHIALATPVSHVWFFKGLPSRIGHLLDISLRDLERILYFEAYVVVDPGETEFKQNQLLTEDQYRQAREEHGVKFRAQMGAEAIKELLKRVSIDELAEDVRERMRGETSVQKKLKFAKRLRVVDSFRRSSNKPEWMILDVVPVIPPELRPLVPLDGGRFATSDLNDLYRRVINRNNRLKKLMELKAPDVIIRNEKRMLQEAVDALFDNGRRGRVLRGANNRPLKSLSDTLKGKQGRFRQNLLGKRVDYSGRSVIVVGPELKLHQCGLPKKMALELFKPFIYHKLEQRELVATIKQAKEMVEQQQKEVWDVLEEVIREHPVLLNRAPTLHRLGIQAFEPVLVEGKAIRIHPLVCTAFNADFDGDQMAVHIPLAPEAQIEASVLMMSSKNILSPANGTPITVPSQDIVLGCYYLTKAKIGAKGEGKVFGDADDVILALEAGELETLSPIRLRLSGELLDLTGARDDQDLLHTEVQQIDRTIVSTTVGRVIFNDALPDALPFINGLLKKKGQGQLVQYCYLRFGLEMTVDMLDGIKNLGFLAATQSGLSIGIDDLIIPAEKPQLVAQARADVIKVEQQYLEGAITNGERYNKVIAIWSDVTEHIADKMFAGMEGLDQEGRNFNPVFIMADSGARGSKQQIRQLAGMRGLMAKPSGEIIETPITSNFREGLTVLQYFISTHGARKGLADTALKTADSGYLTRRLVDVAQDVIISEDDCGTLDGIDSRAIVESGEIIEPLRDRIVGRVTLEPIKDPFTDELIIDVNLEITDDLASEIQEAGIERVRIRSVLTCASRRGVCSKCYGRDLSTGRLVERGLAAGVIAAQSIGEPGTQLTMRTFHIGGTASRVSEQSTLEAKHVGTVRFEGLQVVDARGGALVVMNRSGSLVVQDVQGRDREHYAVVYGAHLRVKDGQEVEPGQVLVEWDPYTFSIVTEQSGNVRFKDIIEGLTVREEVDEVTGLSRLIIVDSADEKKQPTIEIRNKDGKVRRKYQMPSHAHLMVVDSEEVFAGDILAKIPRETTKTKDITGGLPRVVELFEARKPRETAVISEIDGVVRHGSIAKGLRKIVIVPDEPGAEPREYLLPRGVHVNVQEGDRVRAGEPLMDGPSNPHDILSVLGEKALQSYLVNEIQEVYRLQGVNINDKHIEVIVRQMMRWVKIEEVGDTEFLVDEQVDRIRFMAENERVIADGGRPGTGRPMLLGITKASLSTESFISAASFQETTRVLTEASISGRVDRLQGLKENVTMGRLIPAGTGFEYYRRVTIPPDEPPPPPPRTLEELELERQMQYLIEPEESLERGELPDKGVND